MRDHRVGQAHAALLVGRQQLGARDQRGGFVVMHRREERILRRQARVEFVQHLVAETFQRGFREGRADIDAGRVLRARMWRKDAGMHTRPLPSSDPVTVEMNGRAMVLGIPGLCAPAAAGPAGPTRGLDPFSGAMGCYGIIWAERDIASIENIE